MPLRSRRRTHTCRDVPAHRHVQSIIAPATPVGSPNQGRKPSMTLVMPISPHIKSYLIQEFRLSDPSFFSICALVSCQP